MTTGHPIFLIKALDPYDVFQPVYLVKLFDFSYGLSDIVFKGFVGYEYQRDVFLVFYILCHSKDTYIVLAEY